MFGLASTKNSLMSKGLPIVGLQVADLKGRPEYRKEFTFPTLSISYNISAGKQRKQVCGWGGYHEVEQGVEAEPLPEFCTLASKHK